MKPWLILMTLCGLPLGALHAATTTERIQEQARIHTDLASRYYQVGQVAVAVEEAEKALQSDSSYVAAHTVLALIYAQLHQNTQADIHFAAALSGASAKKQSQTDIRNSYAWYLCGSQRAELALGEFALVLNDPLYPSMDKALINAGACAARIKRYDLALPYLNAAIDVNNKNGAAYVYRAHVLMDQNKYQEARENWRSADVLLSNSPEVLWVEVRLAHLQSATISSKGIDELLRAYPTSEQANWARDGRFDLF